MNTLHQPNLDIPASIENRWQEALADPEAVRRLHFTEYQVWAATNWLHPHEERDTTRHFLRKFREEITELIKEDDSEKLVIEAGDSIWVTSAMGIQSNVDLGGYMEYPMGRNSRPRIRDIADYIEDSEPLQLLPLVQPVDTILFSGILDDEPIEDPAAKTVLDIASRYMQQSEILMNYGNTMPDDDRNELIVTVGVLGARLILAIGTYAYQKTGVTFDEIIMQNMQKISDRIESGTLDKSDR